jgi:catechol 2,3-dioxygenase-like lactoylglutathione lyase family enzyme
MTLGSVNHLTLTVSDMAQSEPFYNSVLQFMGYQQVHKDDQFIIWVSETAGEIVLYPAQPDALNKTHDRYSPGLHHIAFNANSRAEVDNLHQLLLEIGATVLDAPAEYDYTPGYYAVFFADPDGIKLELVHRPD